MGWGDYLVWTVVVIGCGFSIYGIGAIIYFTFILLIKDFLNGGSN